MQPKFAEIFRNLPDKGDSFKKSKIVDSPGDTQSRETRRDLTLADLTPTETYLYYNYSSIVGSIGWPAKMCAPHLAQSYSMLSRALATPTPADARSLRRLLQYCYHHQDEVFIMKPPSGFKPTDPFYLMAFSDSNYGDYKDVEYRATTGYAIFLCGILISWKAKRQDAPATSTYQAEMVAAFSCFEDSLWIRNLLIEIGILDPKSFIPFWCDNASVILNFHKPPEDWSRPHLNTKFFACQKMLMLGIFKAEHIPGIFNPADIFTKALPVCTFCLLRDILVLSTTCAFLSHPKQLLFLLNSKMFLKLFQLLSSLAHYIFL